MYIHIKKGHPTAKNNSLNGPGEQTQENLMLFFDPAAEKPFPIFGQSARFYHHPVAQAV